MGKIGKFLGTPIIITAMQNALVYAMVYAMVYAKNKFCPNELKFGTLAFLVIKNDI
jgi:hypothetical protein